MVVAVLLLVSSVSCAASPMYQALNREQKRSDSFPANPYSQRSGLVRKTHFSAPSPFGIKPKRSSQGLPRPASVDVPSQGETQ